MSLNRVLAAPRPQNPFQFRTNRRFSGPEKYSLLPEGRANSPACELDCASQQWRQIVSEPNLEQRVLEVLAWPDAAIVEAFKAKLKPKRFEELREAFAKASK